MKRSGDRVAMVALAVAADGHLVAAWQHRSIAALTAALAAAGVLQLVAAAGVGRSRWLATVGLVVSLGSLVTYVVSRTVGLGFLGNRIVEPVGQLDVVTGLAELTAVVALVRSSLRGPRPSRLASRASFATALTIGTLGALVLPAHAENSQGHHGHATATGPVPTKAFALNPLTPTDPNRITPDEARAIAALGDKADAPLPSHAAGHGEERQTLVKLSAKDQKTFDQQWTAAQKRAAQLTTPEQAAAAGYVRAALQDPGVGTHWVKWSLVDGVFDPAQPEMLLFDERVGRTPQLAGFSYWVKLPHAPAGFAGANDQWHQHGGLCVVNGWVDREQSPPPPGCPGSWLAGGDLWMLHAWVVPRWTDMWGPFATLNPKLCPPVVSTPGIARCENAGG
jgi:hypothetical protein